MATILVPNSSEKFRCEHCDYYTSRKSQFDRHLSTDKHKQQQKSTFVNKKVPKSSNAFTCDCGKEYKDRSGLWRHEKKCNKTTEPSKQYEPSDKELIMMLIKENSELKHMVIDVCQKN